MDEPLHCYRHPNRDTYVSCSECGRGICPDCMVFAPVGIRCPEHANVGAPRPSAARTVRQARGRFTSHPAPVTLALIAINVLVYLITVGQGSGINNPGGRVFFRGALFGPSIADGDWWRIITAMFLHASFLHILFNMLALWWLGSVVEQALGTVRFLLVYFVAGIAGSLGALVASPNVVTVGASGAIFGIMGALLVLEYLQTGSFAGQAMSLIAINLALSFAIANISIGGHIGGLIGGIAASFALVGTRYRQPRYLGPAVVAAMGVICFAAAIARARGSI